MMASTCKWERGGCNVGVTGEVAVGEKGEEATVKTKLISPPSSMSAAHY